MTEAADWLLEPFRYEFMRRALLAAVIVGAVAPLVGTWVVLRRLSYLSDAISHGAIAGVAGAYLLGVGATAGALAAGLTMALLMSTLAAHPRLREDAVIGVVQVALFAAGILVIGSADDVRVDLTHLLFGSVTTVSWDDLQLNAALGLLAVLAIGVLFGDLRATSFDPVHAELVGIRVGRVRTLLLALLAVTVVIALQTVGVLMTIAMVVVPASAARLWTRTVAAMSLLAAGIGVVCAATGLVLSYHLATAPGATIALVAVTALGASFAATLPRRAGRPAAHAT